MKDRRVDGWTCGSWISYLHMYWRMISIAQYCNSIHMLLDFIDWFWPPIEISCHFRRYHSLKSYTIPLLNSLTNFILQTANGVSSKVMDDYCWIHSTFHIRSEYQGNVGCILDNVLAGNLILGMEFQNQKFLSFTAQCFSKPEIL